MNDRKGANIQKSRVGEKQKGDPSNLWRHGESLQVGRDRSPWRAQVLRELAEARASGGGEVEARLHGLEQRSGTRRRQRILVIGQLLQIQHRTNYVGVAVALVW